jgi:hypothetical protein
MKIQYFKKIDDELMVEFEPATRIITDEKQTELQARLFIQFLYGGLPGNVFDKMVQLLGLNYGEVVGKVRENGTKLREIIGSD